MAYERIDKYDNAIIGIENLYKIHDELTDKKLLKTITPEEEKELEYIREKLESQNNDLTNFYQDQIDIYQKIYDRIQSIKRHIENIEKASICFSKIVIDIDEDVVKLNNKGLNNESRKNIADRLRSLIPELYYRFKKGIVLNKDEKLVVTIPNEIIETDKIDTISICDIEIKRKIFKNTYRNVRLYYDTKSKDDSLYLMEGYRHISLEEMHHIIDLIYKPENITFSLGLDLY